MDTQEEIVTASQSIYQGKIVHLRVNQVRLPDGRSAQREIVEHKGAVCIVPVREDGAILMVRQFRLAAQGVLLEIPAGTLEAGEDPDVCAARELEEETGFRAGKLRPLFSMFLAPGYSTERIHAYLATELTPGHTHFDADENLQLEAIPLADLERRILAGEIHDAKTIASLLAVGILQRKEAME